MTRQTWPEIGYNHNVRYRGVAYHVQTEDSGVDRPHVTTHLFRDGGHIVRTMRSEYASAVNRADRRAYVRALMKRQHKALLKALLGGHLDSELGVDLRIDSRPQVSLPPGIDSEQAPSFELDSLLDPLTTSHRQAPRAVLSRTEPVAGASAGAAAEEASSSDLERSRPTLEAPCPAARDGQLRPASAPPGTGQQRLPTGNPSPTVKPTPPLGTRVGRFGPRAPRATESPWDGGSAALRDTTPSPTDPTGSSCLDTATTLRSPSHGSAPASQHSTTPGSASACAPAPASRRIRPEAPNFGDPTPSREQRQNRLSAAIRKYLEQREEDGR